MNYVELITVIAVSIIVVGVLIAILLMSSGLFGVSAKMAQVERSFELDSTTLVEILRSVLYKMRSFSVSDNVINGTVRVAEDEENVTVSFEEIDGNGLRMKINTMIYEFDNISTVTLATSTGVLSIDLSYIYTIRDIVQESTQSYVLTSLNEGL
ncbi:MAG: hypothetical protein J7J80_06155 [Thermotogae bacterium]|nr:hypothetical protein [Thermotogota bacterium]